VPAVAVAVPVWCCTQSIVIVFLIQVQMGHSNYVYYFRVKGRSEDVAAQWWLVRSVCMWYVFLLILCSDVVAASVMSVLWLSLRIGSRRHYNVKFV
jgi:hypothetical protein